MVSPRRPKRPQWSNGHTADVQSSAMEDYAGAWSAERGRCHRFVYDSNGKPERCPEPAVAVGWRQDGRGRWFAVDACERHRSQLLSRTSGRTGA